MGGTRGAARVALLGLDAMQCVIDVRAVDGGGLVTLKFRDVPSHVWDSRSNITYVVR